MVAISPWPKKAVVRYDEVLSFEREVAEVVGIYPEQSAVDNLSFPHGVARHVGSSKPDKQVAQAKLTSDARH